MGVSFLSTVPSFLAVASLSSSSPSSSLPTKSACCPTSQIGVIRCAKIEADFSYEENQFSRRDFLGCIAFSSEVGVITSSGLIVEDANAADLIQRRKRSEFLSNVKDTLSTAIKGNPALISPILTLALNDAMTFDKATKSGGPNGSIRFRSEINRPENKGLASAMSLLEDAKKEIDSYSKGGPIAFTDLIQYAAQAAIRSTFLDAVVRKCGGNEEKGSLLYAAYGSNGQWGQFDKQFGRVDAAEPDPEGRVPQWDKATVKEMKEKFLSVGLGPRHVN